MKLKSVKKNYIYNLIYQITLIIIPLIITPYASRKLLPEGIGRYSFSFSLITYFTLFASFGFENYAQREIAKCQNKIEKQSKVFWEIFFGRLFTVSFSLILHGVLLSTSIYGANRQLMLILSINVISIGVDVAYFFQGNEEFDKLVIKSVVVRVVGALSIFLFVKNSNDLWVYTLIQSLIILFSNAFMWTSLFKRLKKIKWNSLRPFRHVKGALCLFIPSLAISLYTVLDKTLIGVITQSNVQNGYYEQTEKIIKLSMTLITCLGTVMIPRNSKEIAEGNYDKVKDNVYKASNFMWLLATPLVLGFVLIADNLIPWFLGVHFIESSSLLKVFAPLVLIIGFSNILGLQYLVPCKKEKQYTISILIGAGTNILLNIILIYYLGALGAAISTIVAEFAVTISMCLFLRKELSINRIIKTSIKPVIAGVVMFLATYPLTLWLTPGVLNSIIITAVAIVSYAVVLLILKEKMFYGLLKKFTRKIKANKKSPD